MALKTTQSALQVFGQWLDGQGGMLLSESTNAMVNSSVLDIEGDSYVSGQNSISTGEGADKAAGE